MKTMLVITLSSNDFEDIVDIATELALTPNQLIHRVSRELIKEVKKKQTTKKRESVHA